jgi:hypothetical protein
MECEVIGVAMSNLSGTLHWQEGGILSLDNMLATHGRNSYTGAR